MVNYTVIRCFHSVQDKLFVDETTRLVFCRLLEKYVMREIPVYAWSLTNHEALCLTVQKAKTDNCSAFSDELVQAYTAYCRQRKMHSLCKPDYELIPVPDSREELCKSVVALHCWPLLQGLGSNFVEYPWTSYLLILGKQHPYLQSKTVLKWFDNKQKFRHEHLKMLKKKEVLKKEFGDNFINFMGERKRYEI